MRLEITQGGSVAVAKVSGEIDMANGVQFSDEVLGKVPDDATALVVDLTDLRYIDSSGVRSLFDIASALRTRDHALVIAVPEGSPLRSVLKITQVEKVATICSTPEEAVEIAALGPAGP